MRRLIYFGTCGAPGHFAIVVKGFWTRDEKNHIEEEVDKEYVHEFVERNFKCDHAPILCHADNYTIYAIPLSRDDKRGNCLTALITDFNPCLTDGDFKEEIEKEDFLKRQFDIGG
jgi:hypothetical protein